MAYPGKYFHPHPALFEKVFAFGHDVARAMNNKRQDIDLKFTGKVKSAFMEPSDTGIGRACPLREYQCLIPFIDILFEPHGKIFNPVGIGIERSHLQQWSVKKAVLHPVVG